MSIGLLNVCSTHSSTLSPRNDVNITKLFTHIYILVANEITGWIIIIFSYFKVGGMLQTVSGEAQEMKMKKIISYQKKIT